MTDATPINLNKARKARDKSAATAKADENALRYGRTKAQRVLEAAQAEQSRAKLDQLKFEDE